MYLSLVIDAVARILLPLSITPIFSLSDISLINQGSVHYSLYLRRQPDSLALTLLYYFQYHAA
jgi:hypothetical protein